MVKFNKTQVNIIQSLFDRFATNNVTYVVPRGHEMLPTRVKGVDIDIFVCKSDFEKTVLQMEELGFSKFNLTRAMNNAIELGSRAVRQPSLAMKMFRKDPIEVIKMAAYGQQGSSGSLRGEYRQAKLEYKGVHVHLFNHFAYTSPYNGKKVRVAPTVEQGMIKRKTSNEIGIHIPAAVDEIVHLVCRGVFDKEGEFPDYYVDRLNGLYSKISGDTEQKNTLNMLLQEVFFSAAPIVLSAIEQSEYDSLKKDLIRFSDY